VPGYLFLFLLALQKQLNFGNVFTSLKYYWQSKLNQRCLMEFVFSFCPFSGKSVYFSVADFISHLYGLPEAF
jgi:hypothetical protein